MDRVALHVWDFGRDRVTRSLVWFRRDLRARENTALHEAPREQNLVPAMPLSRNDSKRTAIGGVGSDGGGVVY